MFFILSKILSFFFEPFSWIFMLLVGAFFLKNVKIKKRLFASALIVLYLLSNSFLYNLCARAWCTPATVVSTKFDAAIVLLGFTSLTQEPKDRVHVSESVNRITQLIPLYRKGLVSKIILSGGNPNLMEVGKTEATETKQLLLEWGIPEGDILMEGNSRTTYENLVNTKKSLKNKGLKSLLLVTSSYHLPRAMAIAKKIDLSVTPYATDFREYPLTDFTQYVLPSMSALKGFHHLFHEWLGYFVYWLKGYC